MLVEPGVRAEPDGKVDEVAVNGGGAPLRFPAEFPESSTPGGDALDFGAAVEGNLFVFDEQRHFKVEALEYTAFLQSGAPGGDGDVSTGAPAPECGLAG